jgi:Chromate transporter
VRGLLRGTGAIQGRTDALANTSVTRPANGRTLAGLARYFLKLGGWGFGGPIALVGYMKRDLVDERRWFSEEEFQHVGPQLGQCRQRPAEVAAHRPR